MSVTVTGPIFIRPYRGFDNPAFPVAHWMAGEFVTGDASGGNADITIQFKPANQPLSGRLFNIEEITISNSNLSVVGINLQSTGMDRFNLLLGPTTWDQALRTVSGNFESTQPPELAGALPAFLGAAVSFGTQAALQFTTINANGATIRLRAMGYIWEARSILAEGGPQRPSTALYG